MSLCMKEKANFVKFSIFLTISRLDSSWSKKRNGQKKRLHEYNPTIMNRVTKGAADDLSLSFTVRHQIPSI